MGGELKVMWGVRGCELDKRGGIFELYGIKCSEGNGGGGLEGDVVRDGGD